MCESRAWDVLQAIKFCTLVSIYKSYHSISFNSAPNMTHYKLAEISILAGPRFECDIQIFLAGRGEICARSLQIVHCKLNYIYYLYNACKCNSWAPIMFFVFLILFFFEFSDGFGTLPKFALSALHFSKFEHCVICDCQIEWYTALLKNISWKEIHFHFSLHDYLSIQLQLFPVRTLVFLIKCWLLMHGLLNN